ncbi:MAG TPA: DEAD/DEAH box helicase [Acidimicrobiales bacterium]|nr:DEAD/DEAH box helicase [Acidimicrobiales bacterium]
MGALDRFSPVAQAWFRSTFEAPTPAQEQGWDAISEGRSALVLAPTGSGKTLAAFLWALDRLLTSPSPAEEARRCRVLYVSPLKALTHDVERNLRAPLAGIAMEAQRVGWEPSPVSVATRTGDTPARDRRAIARHPPDILITTPESLYLMLTSAARSVLASVELVIVDEVHAVAATKRGTHLALSLERLERLVAQAAGAPPQRVGLSATQRPLEELGRFLGGRDSTGEFRPVTVVDAGTRKPLDLRIVVPVEDMAELGRPIVRLAPGWGPHPDGGVATEFTAGEDGRAELPVLSGPGAGDPETHTSIWPSVHPVLLDLIRAHRSTLVFVNSRRLAERLSARLNELAGEELVRAHHGSIAREQRLEIEDALKAGKLPALVATSSLELGIDMGAIDLVVQVEAPSSVASGLQRVGRAGHGVGQPSKGRIFPKFRGDLVVASVVASRMRAGLVEETVVPRNPLDVLAQQIVAMLAVEELTVDAVADVVAGAHPFAGLTREALEGVLDMLAGRYPSDQFAELRPRIVWDRAAGTLRARPGARMLAVTSGGTIPDRGLFGVYTPGPDGTRVGELDEEFVYESRPGENFLLGATTWRIEDITRDRVLVTPAPGQPGKMPFWHGDQIGRPFELGRAIGAFLGEVDQWSDERLAGECGLDPLAVRNLRAYLEEEREATGGALPTDRQLVVERFRDELGDWRVCVLSTFGARVHAPWALAIEARIRDRLGVEVQAIWSDDGIVVRLPEAEDAPPVDSVLLDPEEVEELVVAQVGSSALFASRFRENAARSLLLPRRRPGSRTPLWQQRQKAADLLGVASGYGSFPVLLETYRECLRDVFDLPALISLMTDVRSRKVRVVSVDTALPSPFASSLAFSYVASFMYEGDAPLAERRAQALTLDRRMLAELVGSDELRELIDPTALAELEAELQALDQRRWARSPDAASDLLRRLGDLSEAELDARCDRAHAGQLRRERRAIDVRIAGEARLVAAEDAGRYRDALGVSPPPGVPDAFLEPVPDALEQLVRRWARTHGPFTPAEPSRRFGVPLHLVESVLGRLASAGNVVHGDFRPDGTEREWCDVEVLRILRQRSLAALRREVEPVAAEALVRFLPAWQGVGLEGGGLDRTFQVISQLQGLAIPASVLESEVLSSRIRNYSPALLDELLVAGEVMWLGAGPLGQADGKVVLLLRGSPLVRALPAGTGPRGDEHERLREVLGRRGACFFRDLAGPGTDDATTLESLWDLVWAGEVTNDSFAPLRALGGRRRPGAGGKGGGTAAPGRRPRPRLGHLSALGPPKAQGRWSLVDRTGNAASATEAAAALAGVLLDRHGVLTREAVRGEGVAGGFAGIYPVLRAMEEGGRIRRGYFVAGLGGAQFALPGAVDRLRTARDESALIEPAEGSGASRPLPASRSVGLLLAATDPANAFGLCLPWPAPGLKRVAGAHVVLVDGVPCLYVERGGGARRLVPLRPYDGTWEAPAIAALAATSTRVTVGHADPQLEPVLAAAGFVATPKGMTRYA